MSLRFKLLIFFILSTLPPVMVGVYIVLSISSHFLTEKTLEKLQAVSVVERKRIDEIVDRYLDDTLFLTESIPHNFLNETNRLRTTTTSEQTHLIKKIGLENHYLKKITLYTTQGKPAHIFPTTSPIFENLPNEFLNLTSEKIIGLFKDEENMISLRIASPIMSEDKKIGFLIAEYSAEPLIKITEDYKSLGQTGEIVLATRNTGGDALFLTPLRFDPDAALSRAVPKEDGYNIIISSVSGGDMVFSDKKTIDYRGVKVFGVTSFIEPLQWGLTVKIDQIEALHTISDIQEKVTAVALIFYLLALSGWLIFGRRVVLPLRKLTLIAQRIQNGNFSERAPENSEDEIGALSGAFNRMAEHVQKAREQLEEKVRERTQELKNKVQELEGVKKATLNILEDLQTEKKNIEADDARDEAMLSSIGDGMIATDEKGSIIVINNMAEKLLGVSRTKVLGKKFSKILSIIDANGRPLPEKEYPLTRVLQTKELISSLDFNYVRKDKTVFPVSITTTPVILDGKLIGAIDTFRDITHQKEVDRAKTEFVSLASHQLRTPLSAINWYAEMLLAGDAGKINKEQKQYLEEIYHGNQRMVDLVNSLLNVSRIDLGTFAVDPKLTNVTEVIELVLSELNPQIMERKQTVTKNFSPDVPIMKADPKLLKIIFQNLLSNAVKYTPPEGRITVSIDLTYKKIFDGKGKQKDGIIIKVQDTGYGIPKKQQDKIFSKLFRADNVREKDTEGTGLGLYIVKAIVDQSDGKIWFDSEEGKGTTFTVTLPLIGMKKKDGTKGLS